MDYIRNIYKLTQILWCIAQHRSHAYKQQPAYYFISNVCKKFNI